MITRRMDVWRIEAVLWNRLFLATLIALAWQALAGSAPAQDKSPAKTGDEPNREAQIAGMRRIAEGLKVAVIDEGPEETEMIADPLFRFNDPARDFSDGSIWGFGKKGRPAALLSLSLHPN